MTTPSDSGRGSDALRVAREALGGSEQSFRLIVESIRDYAILMLDPGGRIVSWNAGAERIEGYTREEILGSHFSVFYAPEDVAAGKPARALDIATREGRFEDEGWRLRKDGTRFWASVVITALRDEHGALLGFAKVTRDLTERVRAERERIRLAQTEEARRWLSTALRSIGDAVITTDAEGNVTLMNPVAEALLGTSLDATRGKKLHDVVHIVDERTRRPLENPVDRVLREGVVVGLAAGSVLVRADGTMTPVADSGAPIRESGGEVSGVVLVLRDATADELAATRRAFMVEATAALASSLDATRALSSLVKLAVPRIADFCAVHVQDDDDRLRQVAVAHVDPERAEIAESAGQRPLDPRAPRGPAAVTRTGRAELHPEVREPIFDEARGALDLHSCVVVPLVAGTRVLGAITLGYGASGRKYGADDLAFAEELARQAAMAVENSRLYGAELRARESADAANRAKDEFLAAVSHELRTPLTAILGWSKMISGSSLDELQRARAAETIERNAVAMTQLVEDLLDVSRIVSGKMRIDVKRVDLPEIIDAALDSVKPALDAKDIELEEIIDPRAADVRGDAARLQQVVWNLLSNAAKFTPSGGHVRVSLRGEAHAVEISVSDDGKGIDQRFLPHVFESFRQAEGGISRQAGGLGLGLAITKHIVELHGGTLDVTSAGLGKGATFTVRLPVAVAHRATAPRERAHDGAPEPLETQPRLEGLRVLMVDDEEDARDLVRAVLEHSGSIVTTASSVRGALDAFDDEVPDVLLSDIAMPGESGYDLIRRVRELPPERGGDVPAAALTAYARPEDRRKALGAGFMMHVPKPVDPAELVAVVAALARHAQPRD